MTTYIIRIVACLFVLARNSCLGVTDIIATSPAIVVVDLVVLCSSVRVRRAMQVECKTTGDITTNTMWWIDMAVEVKELSMLTLLENKFLVSHSTS